MFIVGNVFKEALINSAVRGEVLSLPKGRTMNTEFNKISILNLRDPHEFLRNIIDVIRKL